MTDVKEIKTSKKTKRRSISRPSLVRAIKRELTEVGLADTASIKTFLDAVKDAYVKDNFDS